MADDPIVGSGGRNLPHRLMPTHSMEPDHVRKGIEHLERSAGPSINLSWTLRPLDNMVHAAALFACHFLADAPIRHHAQVTAPRYENRPLISPRTT